MRTHELRGLTAAVAAAAKQVVLLALVPRRDRLVQLASEPVLHVRALDAARAGFRMRPAIDNDCVGIRLRVLHVLCRAIGG